VAPIDGAQLATKLFWVTEVAAATTGGAEMVSTFTVEEFPEVPPAFVALTR